MKLLYHPRSGKVLNVQNECIFWCDRIYFYKYEDREFPREPKSYFVNWLNLNEVCNITRVTSAVQLHDHASTYNPISLSSYHTHTGLNPSRTNRTDNFHLQKIYCSASCYSYGQSTSRIGMDCIAPEGELIPGNVLIKFWPIFHSNPQVSLSKAYCQCWVLSLREAKHFWKH